ncbi:MAG: hypothetical protein ACK5XX_01655 [Holosporales bacterium]
MRRLKSLGKGTLAAALLFVAVWIVLAVLPWKTLLQGQLQQMTQGLPLRLETAGSLDLVLNWTPTVRLEKLSLIPKDTSSRVEMHNVLVRLSWLQLPKFWFGGALYPSGMAERVTFQIGESVTTLDAVDFNLVSPPQNGVAAVGSYGWQGRRYGFDMALEGVPEANAVKFALYLVPTQGERLQLIGATLRRGAVTAVQISTLRLPGFGEVKGTIRLEDTGAVQLLDAALQLQQDLPDKTAAAAGDDFFTSSDALAALDFLSNGQLSGRIRINAPQLRLKQRQLDTLTMDIILRPKAPVLLTMGATLTNEPFTLRAVVQPGKLWQVRGGEMHWGERSLSFSGQTDGTLRRWTVQAEDILLADVLMQQAPDASLLQTIKNITALSEINFQFNNTQVADAALAAVRGVLRLDAGQLGIEPLILQPQGSMGALKGSLLLDARPFFPKISATIEGEAMTMAALRPGGMVLPGRMIFTLEGNAPRLNAALSWQLPQGQLRAEGGVDISAVPLRVQGSTNWQSARPAAAISAPLLWEGGVLSLAPLSGTLSGQPVSGSIQYSSAAGLNAVLSMPMLSATDAAALFHIPFGGTMTAITRCPLLWGEPLTDTPLVSLLQGMPAQLDITVGAVGYNTRQWQNVRLKALRQANYLSMNMSAADRQGGVSAAATIDARQSPLPQVETSVQLRDFLLMQDSVRVTGQLNASASATCIADMLGAGGQVQLAVRGLNAPGMALPLVQRLVRQTALQQAALGVLRTDAAMQALRLDNLTFQGRFSSGVMQLEKAEASFGGGQASVLGSVRLYDNTLNARASVRLAAFPQAPLLLLDITGLLSAPRVGIADRAFGAYLLRQGLLQLGNN